MQDYIVERLIKRASTAQRTIDTLDCLDTTVRDLIDAGVVDVSTVFTLAPVVRAMNATHQYEQQIAQDIMLQLHTQVPYYQLKRIAGITGGPWF